MYSSDCDIPSSEMFVPHSLALINSDSALLVADRENSRIITLATSNMSVLSVRYLSHPVYAVAAPKDTSEYSIYVYRAR